MSDYILFTDSSCDLPQYLADEMELMVQPLTVYLDGVPYKNYLDERELSYEDFFKRLPTCKEAKTSAVNQHDFMTTMEGVLADGKDILYLGFSSSLSGTYSAAAMAAEELSEKYPERKIYTVDTLAASLGQGMLLHLAWQQKQAGKCIEEVRDYIESIKLNQCHWFTVNDLFHLKRGGRVSAATAVIGSALGIKPVMHMDDAGKLVAVGKARGRKAALKALLKEMKERIVRPQEQTVFISHGACAEEAAELANAIRAELPVREVIINSIGPVIGAHAGPGTMALFFIGTAR